MRNRLNAFSAALVAAMVLSTPAAGHEPAGPGLYEQHKLVRITVTEPAQLDELARMGVTILNCRHGVGTLDCVVPPAAMGRLEGMLVNPVVRHDNVQALVDAERARIEQARAVAGPVLLCNPTWYDDYKPRADINTRIDELVAAYPALVQKLTVGTSHEGRTIFGLRVTSTVGSNKPAVLFNGCQHAREWVSPMVNMYILEQLLCGYGSDPDITEAMDEIEFFIIPVVNPDGYEYSWSSVRLWRKNRRNNFPDGSFGVDLNRNWDIDWGGPESTSTDPGNDLYVGPSVFSEPETQALRDFILARPQIVAHIDFHSYSQVILQAWGYTNTLPPDFPAIDALGAAMQSAAFAVNGFSYPHGSGDSLLYLASGTCSDWTYSQSIFGYTVELRPSSFGGGGFELPADQILPTAQENLAAALTMADWATRPVQVLPQALPSTVESSTAATVATDIVGTYGSVQPGTEKLLARIGTSGAFTETALTATGGTGYEGALPAAPCGSVVEYYFEAEATNGVVVRSPDDAPAALHSADVADIVVALADDFEADQGWTAANLGASSGNWQRGVPVDDAGWQYDPAADGDGSGQCFLTQNELGNTDVDDGAVQLVSPTLDLAADDAQISYDYYLYLTVADGTDALVVEIDANDGAGPWTEIARHDTDGGLSWRSHLITQADLDAAGVVRSSTMKVRFTANDDGTPSIVEAGIDRFEADTIGCDAVLGDATGDGLVDVADLLQVLGDWGGCPPDPAPCPSDVDGSLTVDVSDLLLVLANWTL